MTEHFAWAIRNIERRELFALVALHALLQRPTVHPSDAPALARNVAKQLAAELDK